nr:Smr/MutS family protein [Limosilactobacillus equigenerosi]
MNKRGVKLIMKWPRRKKQADKIIHHLHQLQVQQGAQVKEHELINAKGQLNALHQEANPRLKHNAVLKRAKAKHQLKPGDDVRVKSYGQIGTLVKARGHHQWEVQMGMLKMAIDEADLEQVTQQEKRASQPKAPRKRPVRTIQTRQTSARLDLRGKRYEAAMSELDQFIDHALLNNLTSVTIVHGKGTGALRKGTQEYLRSNRRVKSFEFATPSNGGDGATIVFF